MPLRLASAALGLALLWGASGCTVTLYQPMKGLHRPLVLERSPTTFEGLRVLVRCNAHDDFMPRGDAAKLCRFLSTSFTQQGAESEWVVAQGARFVQPEVFDGKPPDLTLEISSRIEHEYDYPVAQVVSLLSLTAIPSFREQTFSQRVVVLGRDNSVLAEDFYRQRFVQYDGCLVWSLNWVLDWLVRSEENKVSGDVGKKDFARDFYGQTSQLVFNASVRSELLGLSERRTARKQSASPGAEEATAAPADEAGASTGPEGAAPADGPPPAVAPAPDEPTPPPPAIPAEPSDEPTPADPADG